MSDSIGETAESVVKATTSQFVQEKFDVIRVPYIKDAQQVEKILEEAKESGGIVCYTIVSPELREHIMQKAMELDVEVIDVLGPMLKAIEKTSGFCLKTRQALSMLWTTNILSVLKQLSLPLNMTTARTHWDF